MAELQVIAHHTIAEGREDETLALYPALAEASRAEPGNVAFEMYQRIGDARRIMIYERYASREAFDAHRETPHFKELLLGQIVPRLADRMVESFDVTH
jgi:quinol monooxygenase YgiN